MASFQAKIRGETLRTGENKNYRHVPFKNTVMASFQAKIGWKMPRKRENTNQRFVSFRSYLTRNRKFQTNSKKIQKIVKYYYGFISSQNTLKKAEKDGKQKLSFRFVTTRHVIENSKNIEKKIPKI